MATTLFGLGGDRFVESLLGLLLRGREIGLNRRFGDRALLDEADEAVQRLAEALRIKPDNVEVSNNLKRARPPGKVRTDINSGTRLIV